MISFQQDAVLLVDKPYQWTSFDVVNYIRKAISKDKKYKVGHAGTLDPLATGLLLICTGNKAKTISSLTGLDKVYQGEIVLGASRPSYDLETEIDQTFPTEHITDELILNTALDFVGDLEQLPPIFSAKKIQGETAYNKARKGEEFTLQACKIQINYFKILKIEKNIVYFEVKCSKGTYIRSLAHDFGKALGSGAYLGALRRTKIGDFDVAQALIFRQKNKN